MTSRRRHVTAEVVVMNVEQSAAGSDVIKNLVDIYHLPDIVQVPLI